MKKYLFILLAIVLSVGLARAASERDNTNIGAGVVGTTDRGVTYDTSFKKIFSSDDNFGQNLYENIHQRVKNEGNDKAAERVLADRSISREELNAIIPGASTLQLMAAEGALDYSTIEARRQEIEKSFTDAKELADLEVASTMEVESTEIFANGDESDSGFDLIADLDVMETILFGVMESAPSGAGETPGSDTIDVNVGTNPDGSPKKLSRAATKKMLKGEPVPGVTEEEEEPTVPVEAVEPTPTPEEAATICPLNSSFNSAVVAARSQERAENGGDNSNGPGAAGNNNGRGASGNGRGGNGAGNSGTGGAGAGADQELTPETPGDYSNPPACNDSFCLKVEKIYKTDSSYQDTDNCIACHFEKINDLMKKTLDHNLVPSKATGNLMETPKCKRSIFNLKQNFILIPQPIMTPPNDDLIVKGDMLKNLVDFWNAYKPFGCRVETEGNLTGALVCRPQRSLTEKVEERVFQQMQEGTPQDKAMEEIRSQVDAEMAEAANIMKAHSLINDAKNQASQYSVLMGEMDAMNGYFEGFMALYQQLTKGAEGESPCETFLTKETCH
jgi:hypothetical protein